MTNQLEEYPGVFARVKAIVTDGFVLFAMIIGVTFIFSNFEEVHENVRMAAFLFIFVFYDPLMTSFAGGTIGHKINGMCVRRAMDYDKKVMLPLAFVRFVMKAALGWISLLSMGANQERRAIHDYAAGSVVLYEKK